MTDTLVAIGGGKEEATAKRGRSILNVIQPESNSWLVDELLKEQQSLTAVEKFAQHHAEQKSPLQERYYRDLIPLNKPTGGQQYAFEVDLDKCSGCKACVSACNSLNGLDDDEGWRDVGLLHGTDDGSPVLQHVTTACHHCLEPACATGCPVNAYEKSPETGIVHHLDDQCIGCQYCVLTCPYDVPKFSKSRGIVRKCDMCHDRLAEGEAPACVQSCPTEAIRITVVDSKDVVGSNEMRPLVPGAPPGHVTFPTTRYVSEKPFARNMFPADYHTPTKEHDHFPLIVMLVLTQLSVGMYCANLFLSGLMGNTMDGIAHMFHSGIALAVGLLALGASVFHLGRPLYAFRAVIGLRHSWLSREIVAFGGFATAAVFYTIAQMSGVLGEVPGFGWVTAVVSPEMISTLGWVTAVSGLLGVYCSVIVYHATRRTFWDISRTAPKFFLTAAILGMSGLLLAGVIAGIVDGAGSAQTFSTAWFSVLTQSIAVATVLKLLVEVSIFGHLSDRHNSSLKRTAKLHWEMQRPAFIWRLGCGVIGGILLPLALGSILDSVSPQDTTIFGLAIGCFSLSVLGELLERYLFFTAVVALKMPGARRQ